MFARCYLEKYVGRLRSSDENIKTFPCPTCRSEFTLKSSQDVTGLPSNHFINNILEIIAIPEKAPVCSRCQDLAFSHCSSCEMFICKKCSESHDTGPANKNHNVLYVKELNKPKNEIKMQRKLYCIKHDDKILECYRKTCKELCCINGVVLNLQKPNHSCVAICEVAHTQRNALQSSCATLDEKLSESKEALRMICEVMKSLKQNAEMTKNQVKENKEKILNILEKNLMRGQRK